MMPNNNLLPPAGDEYLGYKIFEILRKVLAAKESASLPKKWNRHYELSRNRHWRSKSSKLNLITGNLLYSHRQRTVNLLTDNNPTFNVLKTATDDSVEDEAFDKLLRTAEHWWREEEQQSVLESSVLGGETYGVTIEKGRFDPDRENGLGEVVVDLVDPFHFGTYPTDEKDLQKAEANLHFYPMSVRQVRRLWPKMADKIQSDQQTLKDLGDTRAEIATGDGGKLRKAWADFAGVTKYLSRGSSSAEDEDEDVLIVECWVKDDTPGYAGGIRCVTCCSGGGVVLEDRSNPSINPLLPPELAEKTYLWDKFPFSRTPSLKDTVDPWGMSDFEQLTQLQEEVDKTLSQIGYLKDRAARLHIINPQNSGIHNSQFSNAGGVLNPANELVAQAIKYMQQPEIPSDLVNALTIYKDWFFLISGSFELEAAQTPGREVIAYKAIAALLERAATMMRGKIRNYSKMVRERGRMFVSLAQNWYVEDRYVAYLEDGEDKSLTVRGQDMIVPAKLTVVSGSTMPRSQVQEREEAIELFKLGAIDQTELLRKMDWPEWKSVVKRLQAGPLGEFIERLATIGLPPQVLQLFQEIAQMDPKDFEKALNAGEVPLLTDLFTQITVDQDNQPPSAIETKERAEAEKAMAQAQKIKAEALKAQEEVQNVIVQRSLLEEQIRTEQIEQQVKTAGIEFDRQKLQLDRVQAVAGMEQQARRENREDFKAQDERRDEPGRRGIKSDNKKVEGK